MDKKEMVGQLSKRLNVAEASAETILNEMLAIKVVPNFFRKTAVERIVITSALAKDKAELAVNEFVGAVTDRPAVFEEIVGAFTEAALTNDCDRCRDCFNCGSEALSQLISLGDAGRALG